MENETVETVEEIVAEVMPKRTLKERFMNSRPVKFVRRHKIGAAVGAATAVAAGAAVYAARKGGLDIELPIDTDEIVDALPVESD